MLALGTAALSWSETFQHPAEIGYSPIIDRLEQSGNLVDVEMCILVSFHERANTDPSDLRGGGLKNDVYSHAVFWRRAGENLHSAGKDRPVLSAADEAYLLELAAVTDQSSLDARDKIFLAKNGLQVNDQDFLREVFYPDCAEKMRLAISFWEEGLNK